MKRFFLLVITLYFSALAIAQQNRPANAAQIYHELRQLNNLTKVLYLAAHPDDENTALLSWLVNYKHLPTAYLSLTRGDGGQNLIGKEQGAELGLIRTNELLEARKLDGAGQYFSRAVDFGFSKNFDETFKHWDKEVLTGDVAWVYRNFRPDVVICRFPPNQAAGHGQHAASAILAHEAFKVSGSDTAFSDQLEYVQPWQPKRILFNAYRFGSFSTVENGMFSQETGQYDPLMGLGYGELAGISRSMHKSQGEGTRQRPGTITEYFAYVDGAKFTKSIFDGIDTTWNRVGRKEIGQHIEKIIDNYSFLHPANSLPELLKLRKEIASVKDSFWRNEKLRDLDKLILDATGILAEVVTTQPEAIAGEQLNFSLNIVERGNNEPVILKSIYWGDREETLNISLTNDSLISITRAVALPETTEVTQPYWLTMPNYDALYPIPNQQVLGQPLTPNKLQARLTINIGGEEMLVSLPLSYKKLDPLKGDMVEQLRIVPPLSIQFSNPLVIAEKDGTAVNSILLKARKDMPDIVLHVKAGDSTLTFKHLHLLPNHDTAIKITLSKAIVSQFKGNPFMMSTYAGYNDLYGYSAYQKIISYDHIPTIQYFRQATAKVIISNWECKAQKIGYVEGAGDYTINLLKLAGLDVEILKESDFTSAEKLKKYDAIVTGVRVISAEQRMTDWMPVLLKYVENGGTLVMQYNNQRNPVINKFGPYPFSIANLRTTEEDATVKFLKPEHRLLTYPNKITIKDFDGWVQERGLYYADKWDNKYETLFAMQDSGEQPLEGSTLYAKYGKGHYIYTSLSFFRQLPAGNNGAIRLFMNFISAGK